MPTVKISTNIDAYENSNFVIPANVIPRKGEQVSVKKEMIDFYQRKRFPTKLQVINVTYFEDYVKVELHFNETDFQIAKISGVNLFGG